MKSYNNVYIVSLNFFYIRSCYLYACQDYQDTYTADMFNRYDKYLIRTGRSAEGFYHNS